CARTGTRRSPSLPRRRIMRMARGRVEPRRTVDRRAATTRSRAVAPLRPRKTRRADASFPRCGRLHGRRESFPAERTTMTTSPVQTHVAVDTADLEASIAFYRALLGIEPALVRHDYARFDVADPPLLLGLNAVAAPVSGRTGALEHVGIRFAVAGDLAAARQRLAGAGIALEAESDTECCYARLDRVW